MQFNLSLWPKFSRKDFLDDSGTLSVCQRMFRACPLISQQGVIEPEEVQQSRMVIEMVDDVLLSTMTPFVR